MTDDLLPITPKELMAIMQWSPSTYYRNLKSGLLDQFELTPRIGPHRFSRPLVQHWLARNEVTTHRKLRAASPRPVAVRGHF